MSHFELRSVGFQHSALMFETWAAAFGDNLCEVIRLELRLGASI